MKMIVHHPAFILGVLGAATGALGSYALDFGFGEAPQLGLYMVLTGLWFGLIVAFGVWYFGNRSLQAPAVALIATWIAWEVAVNLALQLNENWLKSAAVPENFRMYVSGCAAGAVGAFLTWAGAAAFTSVLRQISVASTCIFVGALCGLLLPLTNNFDSPAILLVPWQSALAAVLGYGLVSKTGSHEWFATWWPRRF